MAGLTANSIPEDIFTHIVRKEMPVDTLIQYIYENPSATTIEHFKAINSHLKDKVAPGQLVIISPPNSLTCTAFEASLGEVARKVDRKLAEMSKEEKQILTKHYDLLYQVTQHSGTGYGLAMTYMTQHKKHVEVILKEIEKAYTDTYKKYGNLKSAEFLNRRKVLFMRLNSALDRMLGQSTMGLDLDTNNIKRSLGLSTKSTVAQWKKQVDPIKGVPGFEENYGKIAKYSKTLKYGGYIGIALDVGQSGLKIHEACTTGREAECTKAKFSEGGRLSGSLVGGSLGGAASAYLTCNVIFGLESAGTSLLWCGIVAGGAGGYFGGNLLGNVGQSGGEVIYKKTLTPK